MNYYKRHIGDYLKDTAHLSLLEHGIYTRLLDVYYTRESAIPTDQAARLIGARTKEEKEALQCVLDEFFDLTGGCWTQYRCETELAEKDAKAKTNRENGKSGGRPKKQTQNTENQNPEITQSVSDENPNVSQAETQSEPTNNLSHKPLTSNQELKPEEVSERGSKSSCALTRTTLSLDFVPDDNAIRLAKQHKLDIDLERDKFIAHYTATADKRDNWQASFRKWLLNAMQYAADRQQVLSAKTQAIDQRDASRQAAAQSVFGKPEERGDERIIDGEYTAS